MVKHRLELMGEVNSLKGGTVNIWSVPPCYNPYMKTRIFWMSWPLYLWHMWTIASVSSMPSQLEMILSRWCISDPCRILFTSLMQAWRSEAWTLQPKVSQKNQASVLVIDTSLTYHLYEIPPVLVSFDPFMARTSNMELQISLASLLLNQPTRNNLQDSLWVGYF